MKQWSRPKPLAAWALVLTAILLVGCASMGKGSADPAEDLREAIRQTVPNAQRRTELLRLTDEWAGVLDQLAEELLERRESLEQLIADYDSERQDFEKFFGEYVDQRAELKIRVIEIHLAMKEQATDAEWRSLEKATQRMSTATIERDLATAGGPL